MKNVVHKLMSYIEHDSSLGRQFFEKTKIASFSPQSAPAKKPSASWITIHFKTYPRLKAFTIDKQTNLSTALTKLFHKRSSVREYAKKTMAFDTLFQLMHNSAGIVRPGNNSNESRRAYPSAGARYPIELYMLSLQVGDIKKGIYHYNVKEDLLELLEEGSFEVEMDEIFGEQLWVKDASVIFFLTGVPERTTRKYGQRGHRYVWIESGMLAQNISLLAEEAGYGSCLIGGFVEDKVISLLDITLQDEIPLLCIAVGSQRTNRKSK